MPVCPLLTKVSHFYPRPPRGGRLSAERTSVTSIPISIHALREEGDPVGVAAVRQQIISIHALREEGDNSFQCSQSSRLDFYPRPPRGGRPYVAGYVTKKTYDFYPRPPRGGRLPTNALIVRVCIFLSTPSARRATFLGFLFALQSGNFYPRPPRGGRRMLH